MVYSFKGIDDRRGFGVSILIFTRVSDPKALFLEHIALASLDRWSRSIGPRGALLTRVDTKISLIVYFLDGDVVWKVNLHKRWIVMGVLDSKGSVLYPILEKP